GDQAGGGGYRALGGVRGHQGCCRRQGVGHHDVGGAGRPEIGHGDGVGEVAGGHDGGGGSGHSQSEVGGAGHRPRENEVEDPAVGDAAGSDIYIIVHVERPGAIGAGAVKDREVGDIGRGRGVGGERRRG